MKRAFSLITFCILLVCSSAWADECVECHKQETPGAVAQWQQSAHFGAKVGCVACHGSDHESIVQGKAPVYADVCAKCHQKAFAEHSASKHGMGLHAGFGVHQEHARPGSSRMSVLS